MQISRIWSVAMMSAVAIALAGCGEEKMKAPETSPAAGVVTLNDKPVEGAQVTFLSADSKKNVWGCAGTTDASGKFEISTAFSPTTRAKGVPVGDYTVTVTKIPVVNTKDQEKLKKEMEEKQKAGMDPAAIGGTMAPKNELPAKYAEESNSDLKVKIEKAGNTKIELKLAQ